MKFLKRIRADDKAKGARQPANLAKVLFLTRMVFGAILPELTFRMIPLADRQRMATM